MEACKKQKQKIITSHSGIWAVMWQKTNHHMQTIIWGQLNRREETGKPLWNFNSHYSYLTLFLAWGSKSSHCVSHLSGCFVWQQARLQIYLIHLFAFKWFWSLRKGRCPVSIRRFYLSPLFFFFYRMCQGCEFHKNAFPFMDLMLLSHRTSDAN